MENRMPNPCWMISVLVLLLPAEPFSQAPAGSRDSSPPSPAAAERGPVAGSAGPLQAFHDAYSQAVLFADAADERRVRVSPKEVDARLAAYAALYPGEDIDFMRVETLLKAEKYLASQVRDAGDRDIENRMSGLAAAGIAVNDGNREALRKALKTESLFMREDVRQFGEKSLELTTLRNQDIMEKSRQMWPLESMRLLGAPDECLANLRGECWATLEEYNAVLGEIRIPRGLPLDTAKAEALREYLFQKQFAKNGSDRRGEGNADSIVESVKARKSRKEWHDRTEGMGRLVMDEAILRATYDRNYRELFQPRLEAAVEVIGSSDSIYVNSAYRALARWEMEAAAARKEGRMPSEEPALPWIPFKEADLPRELSARTDSLQPGGFTRPVNTRLGFFLARVRQIRRLREVSFEEAFPRLVFLATRDKFLRMDSVVAAKSLKYYNAHREEFRIPDTLELTAWLVPYRLDGKGMSKRYLLSSDPGKDTARFAPRKISSLWLAEGWRNRIQGLAKRKPVMARKDSKPFFGPLKGEYGQWYFRVDKAKKAGGFRSFAAARNEILEQLTAPEREPDTLASDSAKNAVLLTLGMAWANKWRGSSKLDSLTDGELQKMIESGKLDTAGLPKGLDKEQVIALSKQRWVEQNPAQSLNGNPDFLKEVEIDYARLFKP